MFDPNYHLQQVRQQQEQIAQEINQLNGEIENKKYLYTKLQGVIEYLEQLIELVEKEKNKEPDFIELGEELPSEEETAE